LFRYIEKIDDYTVKFYLNRMDVAFLQKMAFNAFGIASPENIKKFGGGGDLFVQWIPEDRIILERFEDYWGEKAKTKTVVFRVIKEATARFLELQAGTAQIQYWLPGDKPRSQTL